MVPPLFDVTNTRQEPGARKRSHDDFSKSETSDAVPAEGADLSDNPVESLSDKENDDDTASADRMDCTPDVAEPPSSPLSNPPSPEATPRKDDTAVTQDTSAASTSATTPKGTTKAKSPKSAARKTTGEPPAKKPKLSVREKKAADAEEAKKKENEADLLKKAVNHQVEKMIMTEFVKSGKAKKAAETEEAKAAKAEEAKAAKAKKAAEAEEAKAAKAKKAVEAEAARVKKAAEVAEAKAAKEKKAAEKAAELEEKRKKAEQKMKEKQEKEAVLLKKAVNHQFEKMMLASFLKPKDKTIKTEKSDVAMTNARSPSKSAYDKLFQPFFVKTNVTMAKSPCDEETREAKSKILEAYVDGSREHEHTKLCDNVLGILQIPFRTRRGRPYPSVKEIMAKHNGNSMSMAIDLTTDSHNQALKALESVPVKSLKFREDVRPPYVGTVSGLPAGLSSLRKVAMHPSARVIPTLDYDYDSEAEWQEDDGEDVDLDDMDDEEVDHDEDFDDFLDDSEDVGPARPAFSGGMEPTSTGLCWENHHRLNNTTKTYKYRMEFMLETLEHHNLIDPFSDAYWKPARCTAPAAAAATTTSKTTGSGLSATSAADPKTGLQTLAKRGPPKRPLAPGLEKEFKDYMKSKPHVGKNGLVEVFWSEHPGSTKTTLTALFDDWTEAVMVDATGSGVRKHKKHWKFKDDVQTAAL